MSVTVLLNQAKIQGKLSSKTHDVFLSLYTNYQITLEEAGIPFDHQEKLFLKLLELVMQEDAHPYSFSPYHKAIRSPFDYYQFGLDFFRSLVDKNRSQIRHLENVKTMQTQIEKKENVVLLANHQSEGDPQITNLVLEDSFPAFVKELIFVAGDRVTTDPMAIPFSKGTNLLCIYSKRHIDNPPEKKLEKQLHNRKTMHLLKHLLKEGGKAIYVAPSGGRDRPNDQGIVEIASFDPQSIEMFRLMAQEAKTPTHFYPLALHTYDILPPPPSVIKELGEMRVPKRQGVFFSFENEVSLDQFPGSDTEDRHERRKACALYLENLVKSAYSLK